MKSKLLFFVGVGLFIIMFLGFILTFGIGLATGDSAFKISALLLIVLSMTILCLLDRYGR